MAYDDGFGQRPLGPDSTVVPGYPVPPIYPPTEYPIPGRTSTTSNFTMNLPEKQVSTGCKIFTDIKKANKFMKDCVVVDVDIQQYETTNYEGMVIVVFYEVGETDA